MARHRPSGFLRPGSKTFDRLGRQSQITVGTGGTSSTASLTYNDASQVLTESYSGGALDGLSVTNGYDQFLRRTNLAALNSTVPFPKTDFAYDNASRLRIVTDNTTGTSNSAGYTYVANSPLVSQISFTNGTTRRMVTTKQYDFCRRTRWTAFGPYPSPASPATCTDRPPQWTGSGSY